MRCEATGFIGRMELTDRCLVTGGAGFIGAGVVRALIHRGYDVTVLDSGVAAGFGYVDESSVRLVRGDVGDREAVESALEDCGSIIHLAAQTSVPDSIGAPLDDLRTNVDASLALLDAARHRGIRRFVFASSNAVVGGHASPMHEGLTPFPVSPYGAAKASVEAYLRAYWQAYAFEGVALRFANAYGPWSAHKSSVISAFVKAYLRGGPLLLRGGGHQTRDFVHLDDVVSAVMTSLDAPAEAVAGEVFQVGSGQETSLLELADVLFSVGGGEVAIDHQPASPGDVARNFSDVSKAQSVLGYAPRIELRDGMAATLEWFRANWLVNGLPPA